MAYDAALVLQYAYNQDPLPIIDPIPWENWRDTTANVDGIDGITVTDAELILQHSVGLLTDFRANKLKSTGNSNVIIEQVENECLFKTAGEILGLNISSGNAMDILGAPYGFSEGFLSATNISDTTYHIGLCTSASPEDGTVLMRIPLKNQGSISFNILANMERTIKTINISTDIVSTELGQVDVFPNPAGDFVQVSTQIPGKYTVDVYSLAGKLIFQNSFQGVYTEIDLSTLNKGVYIISVTSINTVNQIKILKQ